MSCWFLPYINMNYKVLYKLYQYSLYTFPPSWTSLPPPIPSYPSRLSQVELPVLYNNFPVAIYFTYGNVYMSVLLSQFIPPSPAPAVSVFVPCLIVINTTNNLTAIKWKYLKIEKYPVVLSIFKSQIKCLLSRKLSLECPLPHMHRCVCADTHTYTCMQLVR